MTKYEYKRDWVPKYDQGMPDRDPMSDILRRRGIEGWELCSVSEPGHGGTVVCYFKRLLENESEA